MALTAVLAVLATLAPNVGAQSPHPWVRPPNHPGAPATYQGDFADPSVIRVGNTYYAYATIAGGSHLPVLRSTNLSTWKPMLSYNRTTAATQNQDSSEFISGRPVRIAQRPDTNFDPWINDGLLDYHAGAFLSVSGHNHLRTGYWAPGVAKIGNQYVAYSAVPQNNAVHRCIRASVSSTPDGPFTPIGGTQPLQCDDESTGDAFSPNGSVDPEPFVDANGTPYLLWTSTGNPQPPYAPTILWARRLKANGTGFAPGSSKVELLRTAPASWEGSVIENPSMVRFGGKYYLFYSGNDWKSGNYATGYAVCSGPLGPCQRQASTPLMKSTGQFVAPGGADAFVAANGTLQLAFHHWVDGTRLTQPAIAYRALAVRQVTVGANGSLSVQGFATPQPPVAVPALPALPSPPPPMPPNVRVPPVQFPPSLWAPGSPRQQ